MKHYAGLDVSVKETSVCVIDEAGATIREAKVASEPEALVAPHDGTRRPSSGRANLPCDG
jgi:hypothetical protein